MTDSRIQIFWQAFIAKYTDYADKEYRDAYYFCDNEADANICADLVVRGIKRATAASEWYYKKQNEAYPKIGELNIVTDWSGNPLAVIKTIKITPTPYKDITEEFAAIEGEGDKSLRWWREAHWAYFSREMKAYGEKPSEDMIIICEEFERVDG